MTEEIKNLCCKYPISCAKIIGERGRNMPGFGGFNEKKKKKQKQNQKSTNTNPSGFGAPVFVAPKVIPKQKKQE